MDSHGISDRGNGGDDDDNRLLLSNLISKENCLSRQYSIGSKKEANSSDQIRASSFQLWDKEHYTTKTGRPLAGLVATSIPKPSNGNYLARRCPTPTLPASYLTLQISARKPAR